MTPNKLVGLILILVGLIDFIVIPRILLMLWSRSGQPPANSEMIIRILRTSGLVLVAVAALFMYQVIKI